MVHRTWKAQTLCALATLWAVAGCSSRLPIAEVEGVVKLGDKPLPHVRIQFMPDPEKGTKGPISSAATDEQGRFKLVCADGRDGAIVGWHRVVITDMGVRLFKTPREGRLEEDNKKEKQKAQPNRVPDKFTTAAHTPLTREVKAEKQEMTFDLAR
jgi:hypothetical protein